QRSRAACSWCAASTSCSASGARRAGSEAQKPLAHYRVLSTRQFLATANRPNLAWGISSPRPFLKLKTTTGPFLVCSTFNDSSLVLEPVQAKKNSSSFSKSTCLAIRPSHSSSVSGKAFASSSAFVILVGFVATPFVLVRENPSISISRTTASLSFLFV